MRRFMLTVSTNAVAEKRDAQAMEKPKFMQRRETASRHKRGVAFNDDCSVDAIRVSNQSFSHKFAASN